MFSPLAGIRNSANLTLCRPEEPCFLRIIGGSPYGESALITYGTIIIDEECGCYRERIGRISKSRSRTFGKTGSIDLTNEMLFKVSSKGLGPSSWTVQLKWEVL